VTVNCGRKGTLAILAFILCIAIAVAGCDYGRMYDQESVKTYERKAPPTDERTVPVNDGVNTLRSSDPRTLTNPMPRTPETVERGRLAYSYFCVHCHGVKLDGNGTVGQSFSPLPTNLRSSLVLTQEDGILYEKIRLGFRRHPALFSTVDPEDAWSVAVYLKSYGAS
jgi:hypothetical protein